MYQEYAIRSRRYTYCTLCSSYDLDDPEFVAIYRSIDDLTKAIGNGLAADYFPLLRYVPTPALKKVKQCMNNAKDFLEKHLDEHRKSYNPSKHIWQIDVLESTFSSISITV